MARLGRRQARTQGGGVPGGTPPTEDAAWRLPEAAMAGAVFGEGPPTHGMESGGRRCMLPPMPGLNLSPGERLIFEGHPSWRAILGFYLKGILLAAIVGAVAKLVGASSADVFLIVLAIIALTVVIGFVKRVATTYTITDRRLNIKRGIVSREIQETRLERVQNVNYRQTVYQRI